jgi:large subunit ribosomal protein L24
MKTRFKPKYNIKKGDLVIVISGDSKPRKDDKGNYEYKPRVVKEVLVDEGKVIVEGVAIVKKHTKPSAQNTKGGIITQEAPIQISKVMLWDEKAKAPVKVKRERKDGKIVRTSKKSGEAI